MAPDFIKNEDPTILKVSGSKGKDSDKEYVKKLSNAVLQTFFKHGVAKLKCVGAASISNADKAILIASEEAKLRGIDLVERKHWTVAKFVDDRGEVIVKTGILKEIIKR